MFKKKFCIKATVSFKRTSSNPWFTYETHLFNRFQVCFLPNVNNLKTVSMNDKTKYIFKNSAILKIFNFF